MLFRSTRDQNETRDYDVRKRREKTHFGTPHRRGDFRQNRDRKNDPQEQTGTRLEIRPKLEITTFVNYAKKRILAHRTDVGILDKTGSAKTTHKNRPEHVAGSDQN